MLLRVTAKLAQTSLCVSLDGNVCDKVQFSPGLILDCLHVLSPVSTYV